VRPSDLTERGGGAKMLTFTAQLAAELSLLSAAGETSFNRPQCTQPTQLIDRWTNQPSQRE